MDVEDCGNRRRLPALKLNVEVIKWDPFLVGSNKQQIYASLEGFPL